MDSQVYRDLLDLQDTKESQVTAGTTPVWPSESQTTLNHMDFCEMWVLNLLSMDLQDPLALLVPQDTTDG